MWNEVRTRLKSFVPERLRNLWRRQRVMSIRRRNRGRDASAIFSEIYQENRWGGAQGQFHSGSGSSEEHARQYAQVIREFVARHKIRHVVDLGCGDFRIGARLLHPGVTYTGIDIVPDLIRSNTLLHGRERVSFQCLDIIENRPPPGDLCLIRQVLQHLSNAQILAVLRNVSDYRYVIVTEHYPAPDALRAKNLDKPCGEDVRVYDGSAVFLDAEPFNRTITAVLLDVDAGRYLVQPGERLRSCLLENRPS